jgi:pyruvate carboxylase
LGPIQAYLDYKGIVQIAINSGCDAIHPGYGFLSENPDFADECAKHNILFVGPSSKIMRSLGNKVEAKKTANKANVPTIPSTGPLAKRNQKMQIFCKKNWLSNYAKSILGWWWTWYESYQKRRRA